MVHVRTFRVGALCSRWHRTCLTIVHIMFALHLLSSSSALSANYRTRKQMHLKEMQETQNDYFFTIPRSIYFDEQSVTLGVGKQQFVDLVLKVQLQNDAAVQIRYYDSGDITNSSGGILHQISDFVLKANFNKTQVKAVPLKALAVGEVTVILKTSSLELSQVSNFNHTFVVVDVLRSDTLKILSTIIGWLYVVCWGVSYYPQLYLNLRAWSVGGFSIDYGLLNVLAYASYTIVMCSMYFNRNIKAIYFREHPHSQIPVEIPDLASVLHNLVVISLLGLQCLVLPREGQKLGLVSWIALGATILAPLVSLPFAFGGLMDWLAFVHVFSYLKIGISLVKYAPQAYMNWRRKSTAGYSPVNICLDFSGSTFVVMQMTFIAINRNDIWSMFGNPAKFGVGFASWIFTGIFMVQNFILYRNGAPYSPIPETDSKEKLEKDSGIEDSRTNNYSIQG